MSGNISGEGRQKEMAWVEKQAVYSTVPGEDCHKFEGRPYTLMWVDKMKRTSRSRLGQRG